MKPTFLACPRKPASRLLGIGSLTFLVLSSVPLLPQAGAQTGPPVLSDFTPASGTVGTKVTVNGENLAGVTAVKFNDLGASFTVFNANQLVATVPSGAVTGPITVVSG